MEFFHDAASDRLSVIEFNPRLASQFADLYRRVLGVDAHAMSLALALGDDPRALPRSEPTAGAAASLVYRSLRRRRAVPAHARRGAARRASARSIPDGLLFSFPKQGHALARDFKWIGSHRYGIVHLGGRDRADLRERSEPRQRAARLARALPRRHDGGRAAPPAANAAPRPSRLPSGQRPSAHPSEMPTHDHDLVARCPALLAVAVLAAAAARRLHRDERRRTPRRR